MFFGRLRHLRRLAGNAPRDLLRRLFGLQLASALFIDVNALIGAEIRPNSVKQLGYKRIDFLSALDDHAQRRGLHAADGKQNAVTNGISARRVHADKPVRIRAAARAGIKRIVIRRWTQTVKPCADGLVGHRRYPQAAHGLFTPRLLIDITENQLAFTPGVRRTDDILRLFIVHQLFDGQKLAFRLFDDLCFHLFRQNRQIFRPPAGIAFIQLLRFLERNQMTKRPRHRITAANQAVFTLVLCAKHAGNIPRNGWFFGNDERLHGFTS